MEMTSAKKLTDSLSVSSFLAPGELQSVAQGFKTVINNRPDSEEPGQASSAEIEAAARALGMEYVHIPVIASDIRDEQVRAFADALKRTSGPALAFCRTGTRSAMLWALSQAGKRSVDDILTTAKSAGYDLLGLRPRLEARAAADDA
jgi:sulfide:quinone oxidoreductase